MFGVPGPGASTGGGRVFFEKKIGGEDFFFEKKGGEDFFTTKFENPRFRFS